MNNKLWFIGLTILLLFGCAVEVSYLLHDDEIVETQTNLKIYIYSFNYGGQTNVTLDIWLFNESRTVNYPLTNVSWANVQKPCTLTFRLIPNQYENVETTLITNETSEYKIGDDPLLIGGVTADGEGNWFISLTYLFEDVVCNE